MPVVAETLSDGGGTGGVIQPPLRVAIQGELGSNSHRAVVGRLGNATIVPCERAVTVLDELTAGRVDLAVLPVENTLHGSVAEHYDLLLHAAVKLVGEILVRVRHHVIAAPGVTLGDVRRVLSHPVALSQCRRWLSAHPEIAAEPFYDTAGSVKAVVERGLTDTAGVAPALAAEVYGGSILEEGIEDHPENYTRFHMVARATSGEVDPRMHLFAGAKQEVDKLSVAFALDHRPGTLVRALGALAATGADLTRIESRPTLGSPWEYVFFADMRCQGERGVEAALRALGPVSANLRELGRYQAARSVIA